MEKMTIPEKWCIEITSENKEVLGKWRTHGRLASISGWITYPGYYTEGVRGYYEEYKPKDCIEITFDEFKEHVLGERKQLPIYEIF